MFIPSPDWFAQGARWVRQGYRAARRQASHDHRSLWTGWYAKQYLNTYGSHFYAIAACAPSEHLRTPHDVNASSVQAFLSAHVPLSFPAQPFQSYPNVVMYEVKNGSDTQYAGRVLSSGLVELFVRVPHETNAEGGITLDLVHAFQPLAWLLAAVRDNGYKQLFQARTATRLLDWYVGLSPSISTYNGSHLWNDLRFPGRRPQMRGAQGATPNRGLVEYNRRQRAKPEAVLTNVVTSFVREAGWSGDDVAGAVADTVGALLASAQ
jgi:hypothetical protein